MNLIDRYDELCREARNRKAPARELMTGVYVESYPDDEDERYHVVLDEQARRERAFGVDVTC